MSVGKDVARRREHGDSLLAFGSLYKHTGSTHFRARCSTVGDNASATQPQVVSED
jgi:hypothetical protein